MAFFLLFLFDCQHTALIIAHKSQKLGIGRYPCSQVALKNWSLGIPGNKTSKLENAGKQALAGVGGWVGGWVVGGTSFGTQKIFMIE